MVPQPQRQLRRSARLSCIGKSGPGQSSTSKKDAVVKTVAQMKNPETSSTERRRSQRLMRKSVAAAAPPAPAMSLRQKRLTQAPQYFDYNRVESDIKRPKKISECQSSVETKPAAAKSKAKTKAASVTKVSKPVRSKVKPSTSPRTPTKKISTTGRVQTPHPKKTKTKILPGALLKLATGAEEQKSAVGKKKVKSTTTKEQKAGTTNKPKAWATSPLANDNNPNESETHLTDTETRTLFGKYCIDQRVLAKQISSDTFLCPGKIIAKSQDLEKPGWVVTFDRNNASQTILAEADIVPVDVLGNGVHVYHPEVNQYGKVFRRPSANIVSHTRQGTSLTYTIEYEPNRFVKNFWKGGTRCCLDWSILEIHGVQAQCMIREWQKLNAEERNSED